MLARCMPEGDDIKDLIGADEDGCKRFLETTIMGAIKKVRSAPYPLLRP